MSENHATPQSAGQPTPQPLCAIFEPQLPLLSADGLTADERASLEEHLAGCAWCQNRLATLDVVDAALRRHYASVLAATAGSGSRARVRPVLTLEDIMKADQEETKTATSNREPPTPLRQFTPRQRQLTALGAIAAVLVLAVLAASLFSYFGGRSATHITTPTPVTRPTATIHQPNPIQLTPTPIRNGNFTEYPIVGSIPEAITTGPDGNLWAVGGNGSVNGIGGTVLRITPSGSVTEFKLGQHSAEEGITKGPDGNLWFIGGYAADVNGPAVAVVGRMTPGGELTTFPLPKTNFPCCITNGPDGNFWFTENGKIDQITPAGQISEYPLNNPNIFELGITSGPDGALWFPEEATNSKIGRITTSGSITEYSIPTANSAPYDITSGPDGALWFTENGANKIGRITTSGSITEYPIPTANAGLYDIISGPDGALWFTEAASDKIGRITTSGSITEYSLPTADSYPTWITKGPDGAIWFTETDGNRIGRLAI